MTQTLKRKIYMESYNKEYWLKNGEKLSKKKTESGYYKKYYRDYDRYNTYMRDWYKKDKEKSPEKHKAKQKRDYQLARESGRHRYQNLRTHAKKKGLECFSQKDFIKWFDSQDKVCVYCDIGQEVSIEKSGKVLQVDRLDCNKGYILGNISLACFMCNVIKNNFLTQKETRFIGQNVIKQKWLQ